VNPKTERLSVVRSVLLYIDELTDVIAHSDLVDHSYGLHNDTQNKIMHCQKQPVNSHKMLV